MTVEANQQKSYTFTSDGSATVTVPIRILNKDSFEIYVNGIPREYDTYSVTDITLSFNLTMSPAPLVGDEVIIIQRYVVEREADFKEGQTLTASAYNLYQDNVIIMIQDLAFQIDKFTLRYGPQYLNSITKSMLEIPVPHFTGIRALSWNADEDHWEFDENSADQVVVNLSNNSSAETSGATLVGYWDGEKGTTVQQGVTSNYTLSTAEGARSVGFSRGGDTITLERELNNLRARLAALEQGCTCESGAAVCLVGDPHWVKQPAGYGPITVSSSGDPVTSITIGGFSNSNSAITVLPRKANLLAIR